MLPVGFIGFGQQASAQHAWYLVNHGKGSARIVAVCDILADQATVTADRLKHLGCHDTAVYTMDAEQARRPDDVSSVREMLARHPEIEAVIISTPPAKHYHQARACLESGVNVLVDKPPALTYEHALHLTQLVNGTTPM